MAESTGQRRFPLVTAMAPHDLIFISVGLLFIYCVATIAAAAVASVLMKDFGPRMLFIQNAYVHLGIAALALWGLLARPRRSRARAGWHRLQFVKSGFVDAVADRVRRTQRARL